MLQATHLNVAAELTMAWPNTNGKMAGGLAAGGSWWLGGRRKPVGQELVLDLIPL